MFCDGVGGIHIFRDHGAGVFDTTGNHAAFDLKHDVIIEPHELGEPDIGAIEARYSVGDLLAPDPRIASEMMLTDPPPHPAPEWLRGAIERAKPILCNLDIRI